MGHSFISHGPVRPVGDLERNYFASSTKQIVGKKVPGLKANSLRGIDSWA
jgi:hypothetical protein